MENTRKRIAKRLLSFTVMLAMLAAMIPLAAMPDSPIAMEVGAFTNQSDFAPGGHTVTVNNITATVIAYNPSAATATVDDISLPARTMRVQLSGTPSVPTRASSPGTTQNNQSGTRGTAGPYNYLIYARANGGKPDEDGVGGATFKANNDTTGYRQGVMPSSELITNLHLLYNTGTAITGAAATVDLTMPAGANQGTIVLYIGMRSHRLNVTSGGSSTTTHIGATQTTTNALTMNGVRMEVKHSGNSQYSGVASYDHIGTLNQGGSITTWFEADSAATGGVDAATGASNTGSNNTAGNNAQDHRSPRSPVKQDVRTFHYYSGDTATGSGSWTMDIGGPGAMILRAEFSGLPSLGGALSANGLSGNATGILNTSGTHSYTVNVPLTGTTLASGNHVVSLDLGALHANGYRIDGEEPTATKATRVFHLNGGTNISTATPRSVRFIVTHTTGNIGTAGLAALTNATTGLKLDFAFHSDVAFSAAAVSGVSATGTARFNNAAELVTVTVNLAGTRDPGGYYTVQLTGTGLPPATTADIRIINTASPMTQTWTISTIDPNIVKYGLGVKIEFIAETTNPTREPWSREKEDLRVAAHAMWSSATEGNVRLTLSSPVTEVANRVPGTYRISLTTNGTDRSEYRFYHSSELRVLPLNHNFSLPFAGVGELQKNNLDVIIDFFPDIITDRNGIVATGKIQANADRTIIDIDLRTPLGAVVEDTGYYTVALIKKDADDKDIFLERTEPRKYTLDGRVADSVTLELLGAMDMEDVLDLKLSIGFDSDTAYIYEIDYYNENLVFGSVVKYGIDIQYVILKPGGYTKFKDAPEKAKWIPTASGVIDLTRHIPKKGTAPAGSAAIVLRYIGSDEAGFMEETGAVVDPVTKVITKFAYKEGDIPRTKKGDEWVDGFTGDFIEIKPRPFDAAMKGKVKDFYNVGRMMFVNETGKTVEVLFGMDR
ncbi:MAG: hypothetical protein FWD23_15455, partial [Oscillospiraceae bacterium]|nr:hypothetical protein [Oscillospiraceae bacterium]